MGPCCHLRAGDDILSPIVKYQKLLPKFLIVAHIKSDMESKVGPLQLVEKNHPLWYQLGSLPSPPTLFPAKGYGEQPVFLCHAPLNAEFRPHTRVAAVDGQNPLGGFSFSTGRMAPPFGWYLKGEPKGKGTTSWFFPVHSVKSILPPG